MRTTTRTGSLWTRLAAVCGMVASAMAAPCSLTPSDPVIFTVTATGLTAQEMSATGTNALWAVSGSFSSGPYVVPDGGRAVLLLAGSSGVSAFDAEGGVALWTIPTSATPSIGLDIGVGADAQRQFYTNGIVYPLGAPRAQGAPLVVISDFSNASSILRLVDSRTGAVHWSRTMPFEAYGAGFVRNLQGGYDVLIRGARIGRLEGSTGNDIWTIAEAHRTLVPVFDMTGDGECDLVSRANWSSVLKWYDGATGALLGSEGYASFDILGLAVVPGASGSGCGVDLIGAAQGCTGIGGGGALFRRSACPPYPTIQWDSTGYCNQTMLGLVRRGADSTVLSGLRHQGKVMAVDAEVGSVLWVVDSTVDSDHAAVGATDVTGDGRDDVLILGTAGLRLHDGMTGTVVSNFGPLPADRAAVWVRDRSISSFCPGDGTAGLCPCGNFGAAGSGCANSTGIGGVLVATGSASISASDLVLRGAGMVPGHAGLYLQGSGMVNGGSGIGFGDGLRCAGGNLRRLQVRIADASGASQTSVPIALAGGVLPAQTRFYQVWYRDVPFFGIPCGSGFNLSNGLRITWAP